MKYDELKKLMGSKGRRKPRYIESNIQKMCVQWFRLTYPTYLCFSVPNGGSRNEKEAAHLKEEGALSGVSDLILIAENSILFVEMKSPKGIQQETQKKFERNVTRLGFSYRICRSLSDFQLAVEHWLRDRYGL